MTSKREKLQRNLSGWAGSFNSDACKVKNDQSVLLPVTAQPNPELHMVIRVQQYPNTKAVHLRKLQGSLLPDPCHMTRDRECDAIYRPVTPPHPSLCSPPLMYRASMRTPTHIHAHTHTHTYIYTTSLFSVRLCQKNTTLIFTTIK